MSETPHEPEKYRLTTDPQLVLMASEDPDLGSLMYFLSVAEDRAVAQPHTGMHKVIVQELTGRLRAYIEDQGYPTSEPPEEEQP